MANSNQNFYLNLSNDKIININDIIFENNLGILVIEKIEKIDKDLQKIIKKYLIDLQELESTQDIKSKIINISKNYTKQKYGEVNNCLVSKILNQVYFYNKNEYIFIKMMDIEDYDKYNNVNKTLNQIKKQNK